MIDLKFGKLAAERQISRVFLLFFSLVAYAFLYVYVKEKIPEIRAGFLLTAGIPFAFSLFLIFTGRQEILPMGAILIFLGFCYFFVAPFQMIPDEPAHFFRAFEVSMGKFIPRVLSDGHSSGDILPLGIRACYDKSAVIDWNNIGEVGFSGTALYSPFSYIPQSVGIFIARHFTNRVATIYYAGRLFNFLCALSLSVWALRTIPFGRKILFVIMLIPMTMQEMISLAPDAQVNALSFALVAFILHLAYEKESVDSRDIAIIGAMLSVIALSKIVYVVLFLLVYLVPNKKLKDRRGVYLLKIAVPLVVIALNLVWLSISSHFLVAFSHDGSDAKEQVKYVLRFPKRYVATLIRTFFARLDFYVLSCFGGSLGLLNIGTNIVVRLGFFALLLFESARCDESSGNLRKSDVAFFLLVFLGVYVLIMSSLYVQWTAVRSKLIEGVQGRYFIPILPCLFFPAAYLNFFARKAAGNGKPARERASYTFILVIFCNFVALADVCAFYPELSGNPYVASRFDKNRNVMNVELKNVKKFKKMKLAIWSEKDGQDDIRWFSVENPDGLAEVEYTVDMSQFSDAGNYLVHLWKFHSDDTPDKYLASTNANF